MGMYEYISEIDSMVAMCSEKRDLMAFGCNYIEHYCYENWRILENIENGRCIKFHCSKTPKEYEREGLTVAYAITQLCKTIIIPMGSNKVLLFNTKLTRRRSIALANIKLLIYKLNVRRMLRN